jgi:cellulose synthase/poly-beta-1,6-N-acetylglucosamine synthase-like glycosyltransferase
MLFSVVIPAFNRRTLLAKTLSSARDQTFRDFEIIVVDDGSTDGTAEWLSAEYPDVRLYRQANKGPAAARNFGATVALGEWLAFIDSDDRWFPWSLETFASVVGPNVSLVGGAPTYLAGDGAADRSALLTENYPDFIATAGAHHVGGSLIVVRRTLFLERGGFWRHRSNAEDHDLCLRLGDAPGFVAITAPFTLAVPPVANRSHSSQIGQKDLTLDGVQRLVQRERSGLYPGGPERQRERRAIITLHTRPVTIASGSWALYARTIDWHLAQKRWKFLIGFPLKALTPATP